MALSETSPLVDNSNREEETKCKGQGLGFFLGLFFAAGLVGAYFLGTFVNAPSSTPSNNTHQRSSRHYANDDFVRMDDNADDEKFGPQYVGTQFISFTINTIGGLEEEGECEGRIVSPEGVCYLGNANNITEDIYHRLSIVKKILKRLKADAFTESPDIDHADDVLKIVMFPEFFWRGPNGAYSTSQMFDDGILVEVSNVIRDLISEEFFNDFLFVFGTIIAARSQDDPREPWMHDLSAEEVEYFNFAPVAKGGPGGKHFIITKKYISGADFLSRQTLPNPSDESVYDYAKMDAQLEAMFASRDTILIKDNVVELDGLRISIEICLDHRLGVLWNELRIKHHGELVDVLLITSAGMAIDRGPNPVVPGGVVYLSDGGASSAACMRTDNLDAFYPNQVCRGDIGGLKHVPVGGHG